MNNKPNNKGVIIKPGHPHSDGLTASYLFNDNGNTAYDFTKNGNDLSVVGASFVDEGLECNADGEHVKLDNTNQVIKSDVGTLLFYIKPYSVFNDSVRKSLVFLNKPPVNLLNIEKRDNNLHLHFNNGSTVREISIDETIITNDIWLSWNLWGFHWNKYENVFGTDKMAISLNGVFLNPTSKTNSTDIDIMDFNHNEAILLNHKFTTTRHYDCIISYLYIYNKALSESTSESIYDKPYDMFLVPTIPRNIKISYANAPHEKKETLVLNESHAHAQNLVAAYPFKKCYDLRYSFNHDFSKNNNVLDTQSFAINSQGIYCGNFADYSYLNNANEPLNIDEGTIVIEFKNYFSQTIQCLFGRYAVGSAGDFVIMKYSDGNFYFLLNDGTGDHYVYINLSKIPNWDLDFTQIAVLWRRTSAIWNSDNMVINIDGAHVTPDGQLNETSWNTGSLASIPYYIGSNSADANQYASGPIRRCYMYDTVLTEAQLLSIKNDSYEMFED